MTELELIECDITHLSELASACDEWLSEHGWAYIERPLDYPELVVHEHASAPPWATASAASPATPVTAQGHTRQRVMQVQRVCVGLTTQTLPICDMVSIYRGESLSRLARGLIATADRTVVTRTERGGPPELDTILVRWEHRTRAVLDTARLRAVVHTDTPRPIGLLAVRHLMQRWLGPIITPRSSRRHHARQ